MVGYVNYISTKLILKKNNKKESKSISSYSYMPVDRRAKSRVTRARGQSVELPGPASQGT